MSKVHHDMTGNRRTHARFSLHGKLTVTMNDVILHGTQCRNISFGGMCISISDRIDTYSDGMLILIHKCGDEAIFFKTHFSVSWNSVLSPNRYVTKLGLMFTNINEESATTLEKVVSHAAGLSNTQ